MNYIDIFEQRGHLYNEAHVIAPKARELEVENLLKWLDPCADEKIIVTAAGGGYDAIAITQYLAPAKTNVVCVEPSKRFSEMIPSQFQVLNEPLESISLPDNCADAVVNLAALHHCSNRDVIFNEWDRLLKPGGRVVVADVEVGSANAQFLNIVVNEFTPGGHDGDFLRPSQLSDSFTAKDYLEIQENLELFDWHFDSEELMVEFSRCLFGMVKANDEQVLNGIKRYLEISSNGSDGQLAYSWPLRYFRARKP